MNQDLLTALQRNVITPVIQVGIIAICALIALRLVVVSGRAAEKRINATSIDAGRRARLGTILNVTLQTARFMILLVALLMVLSTLGVNIAPLLAGLGVMGLALSLGAQTLIKDMIGGILILLEDQFNIGDAVKIGDETGVVEKLSLRATYLRDIEGRLILIPNGDVRIVSNVARDWGRAIVDINVAFDSDMERVVQVLGGALQRAQQDPEIAPALLEPPVLRGWSRFTDWAVQVRVMAKTQPGEQIKVASVLRRHSLQALNDAGIKVAVAGRTNTDA